MKKIFFIFSLVFLLTISVSSAMALLVDMEDGTVLQIMPSGKMLMWLRDANYANGMMAWDDAKTWAANLNFAGHDDWRLPTSNACEGYDCTGSEMGYLYYTELGNVGVYDPGWENFNSGPFVNIQRNGYHYWTSTIYRPNPDLAYVFGWTYGNQSAINYIIGAEAYAWAVRDVRCR